MPAKIGIRCKIYINTGTYSSPTWDELTSVNDFKQNVAWNKVDAHDRGTRIDLAVKTSLALSWTGNVKTQGDSYDLVLEAVLTDKIKDCLILNGDKATEGVTGWRSPCQFFSANQDQGRGTVLYDEIEVMPTVGDSTNAAENKVYAIKIGSGGTLTKREITGDDLTYA